MGAEDDYTSLNELAERLGLEDKERDSFVSSSMQRLGYKPKTSWEESEPEDGSGGGDFFSGGGRRQQRTREVAPKKRASGAPFGYE